MKFSPARSKTFRNPNNTVKHNPMSDPLPDVIELTKFNSIKVDEHRRRGTLRGP